MWNDEVETIVKKRNLTRGKANKMATNKKKMNKISRCLGELKKHTLHLRVHKVLDLFICLELCDSFLHLGSEINKYNIVSNEFKSRIISGSHCTMLLKSL